MRIAIVTAVAGALLLGGCSGRSGIVTGAIPPGANTGKIVGSPVASGEGEPTIGPMEGGLTGADVGRSLSDADRKIALKAEYEALEYSSGLPTKWQSADGTITGTVTVGGITRVNSLDCRDYTHSISIGGRTRVARGTACRQPDGVWRIVG